MPLRHFTDCCTKISAALYQSMPRRIQSCYKKKPACNTSGASRPIFIFGALGETRTRTACATAPSRQRVYQFHHQSKYRSIIRPNRKAYSVSGSTTAGSSIFCGSSRAGILSASSVRSSSPSSNGMSPSTASTASSTTISSMILLGAAEF